MEVADWEAAAFEPSSAATATLEVPGVSSAKAGVANVASIRIAHAKKEGRTKPEHRTSCDAYRCKTVPCMSALCSIQLLNGDDANTLEGSAGRVNRWKTWWLEMRGFGKRGFSGFVGFELYSPAQELPARPATLSITACERSVISGRRQYAAPKDLFREVSPQLQAAKAHMPQMAAFREVGARIEGGRTGQGV